MEERLHSRFEWGLIADIEPPDLETKVAILRRKAELQRIDLPDDVALFLASNSKHNIRELEGSLIRVLAMASLRGVPLSKTLAQDAMRNVSQAPESDSITHSDDPEGGGRLLQDRYRRPQSAIEHAPGSFPRQIAMYLCKRLTRKSFPEIGRQFGGKHHTTVMHSVEKIDQLISSDREIEAVIKRLTDSIGV